MKRTNTFTVRPLSEGGEHLPRDVLDASAALWNETTYERLMRYTDEDGFEAFFEFAPDRALSSATRARSSTTNTVNSS
jgi:hypothetical protein